MCMSYLHFSQECGGRARLYLACVELHGRLPAVWNRQGDQERRPGAMPCCGQRQLAQHLPDYLLRPNKFHDQDQKYLSTEFVW